MELVKGQKVIFKDEYSAVRDNYIYEVVEDRGDRVLVVAINTGLSFPPQESAQKFMIVDAEKNYLTKRVFKNGDATRIVEEHLTREEAKEQVAEDLKTNPDGTNYMLVFDFM